MLTGNAGIFDFEVVLELDVARSPVLECRLDDVELTRPPTGASSVEDVKYVEGTPEEAEICLDAAADPHATVDGASEKEHLVATALGLEARVVAQFADDVDVVRHLQRVYVVVVEDHVYIGAVVV